MKLQRLVQIIANHKISEPSLERAVQIDYQEKVIRIPEESLYSKVEKYVRKPREGLFSKIKKYFKEPREGYFSKIKKYFSEKNYSSKLKKVAKHTALPAITAGVGLAAYYLSGSSASVICSAVCGAIFTNALVYFQDGFLGNRLNIFVTKEGRRESVNLALFGAIPSIIIGTATYMFFGWFNANYGKPPISEKLGTELAKVALFSVGWGSMLGGMLGLIAREKYYEIFKK